MNKLYFFSILLLAALTITSCGDADPEASVKSEADKIADQLKETIDEEIDKNIETVVTTDEEGNQVVTKIETKEDGTKVETTIEATAEEIREIVEKGELMEEGSISELPELVEDGPETIADEKDDYNFHEYKNLNSLLSTYVSYAGNVNYAGIKSNKSKLEEVIKEFESNFPGSDWSSAQKLTYWINAYNTYTIKLIVDNYPVSSITKITAKPWHKKFIKLNGSTYSLNQIENEIIRKRFSEPRIHFALNCASESCPVLLNKAYTPGTVYSKMTAQTKRFLNDKSKNTFGDKEVQISKIFDWYGEDFTKGGKTVFDFINKYRTEQLDKQKITYQEYSWDLNK